MIRLADEIAETDPATLGFGPMYRWVYLFPLTAVHLRSGELAKAVNAARQIIDPSQQLLPRRPDRSPHRGRRLLG